MASKGCYSSLEYSLVRQDKLTHRNVKLSNLDKILGIQERENLLDKIILNAKILIFNNRKNGKKHNILDLKRKMFRQLQIEDEPE